MEKENILAEAENSFLTTLLWATGKFTSVYVETCQLNWHFIWKSPNTRDSNYFNKGLHEVQDTSGIKWYHRLSAFRCLAVFFSLEKHPFDSSQRQMIGDAGNKELPVCLFFHYCLLSWLSNITNEVGREGIKIKCFYKVSSQIKISFEFRETQVTCPSFDSLVAQQRGLSNYLQIMLVALEMI